MPTRIQHSFADLRRVPRAGLVTFITAGDPTPAATLANMHALVCGGADLIELGVPFSDPMADGPIIQRASERALAGGMSLSGVLALVSEFRTRDNATPVVLMGYLNPIERMGYQSFAQRAAAAGVDGVLTVDLPPEEASEYAQAFHEFGLDQIYSLAPTSDADRMRRIVAAASGFVYYVSVKGVTGAKTFEIDDVRQKISALRALTTLPVGVGFGVKTPEIAAALSSVCDAVIVGSALVEIIERHPSNAAAALETFVASLRQALASGAA
ncbi:MAG: tryptophan synthase subunit alpha [Gammaproteobacteria bacterium]|nr:tryptophan synthase subunit alpha [Gammaproteobacteria bacterium]